jgi:Tfp pilus assembly protein PilN
MSLRINLLPPEVVEARRWDKWYRYVFFGFFALLILVLLIAAWLWMMVQTKTEDLQGLKEQSQQYAAQAQAISVFEERQQELEARREVTEAALADRVNLGRIADDISLVMPEEAWLEALSVGESAGLAVAGYTPLTTSQSVDVGYKSVAKIMVRLASLPELSDVWIDAATTTDFSGWQVEAGKTAPTTTKPVVKFALSGEVVGGRNPDAEATGGSD